MLEVQRRFAYKLCGCLRTTTGTVRPAKRQHIGNSQYPFTVPDNWDIPMRVGSMAKTQWFEGSYRYTRHKPENESYEHHWTYSKVVPKTQIHDKYNALHVVDFQWQRRRGSLQPRPLSMREADEHQLPLPTSRFLSLPTRKSNFVQLTEKHVYR